MRAPTCRSPRQFTWISTIRTLVQPVSREGGVLAVPDDDWKEIVEMHHRSAQWSALMARVSLARPAEDRISTLTSRTRSPAR
jgi:hypothetical protein